MRQKILFGISKLVKQMNIFSLPANKFWVFFTGNGKRQIPNKTMRSKLISVYNVLQSISCSTNVLYVC